MNPTYSNKQFHSRVKLSATCFCIAALSIIFVLLPGPVSSSSIGAAQTLPDPFKNYLRLGIDAAMNMDFQKAFSCLQKSVELEPEDPAGYAYFAMISMMAYETSLDDLNRRQNQEIMRRYIGEALSRGEKRIAHFPDDSRVCLAIAIAKFVKMDCALHEKQYLAVFREASSTWDYLKKAQKMEPLNYDIYFPIGLIHYHIDHLPALTKFLSALILVSGDRQKGLEELELAAQNGDLFKQMALLELVSVYLNFEKQPERAMPIAIALKKKFPNNFNLYFMQGNTLSDLHQFESAFKVAGEIEKNIQTARFPPQLQSRYDQLMGRILFTQGDYARAEEHLQKALRDMSICNARTRAWSLVRLGMISDIGKNREKARMYYSKALETKGGEGVAQLEAKKYLSHPYAP